MIDLYTKYHLSKDYINDMLKNSLIIFDTSALLDLYYYSPNTRNEIRNKVFSYFEKRLWIPSQVYYEFLKNKSKVSHKPIDSYKILYNISTSNKDSGHTIKIQNYTNDILSQNIKHINDQIQTLKEKTFNADKHPFLDESIYKEIEIALNVYKMQSTEFNDKVSDFVASFELAAGEIEKTLLSDISEDVVHEIIKTNFQLGDELSFEDMLQISHEGVHRYAQKIPPGYEDTQKQGLQKYGDLFCWKQILLHAKNENKDVILISNDIKSDWYDKKSSSPCFELLKEFNSFTNKSFWMFNMKDFIWTANKLLNESVDDDTIIDIETQYNREDHEGLEAGLSDLDREIRSYRAEIIPDNLSVKEESDDVSKN